MSRALDVAGFGSRPSRRPRRADAANGGDAGAVGTRRRGAPPLRWWAPLLTLFLLGDGVVNAAPAVAAPSAAQVIVVANRADADSLRVARHYAAARAVPEENIIALKLPLTETITWREFVMHLWQPLLEQLVRDKWIDAISMALTDSVGRQKYAPYGHRIAAIVLCRGVPLKVAHDTALAGEALPFTHRGEFRTNAGSVDGELSLLGVPNYNINALTPNPLFANDRPSEADRRQVVKVARLDGPTVEDALQLVDRALEAERTGLLGRAYVDLSDRDPVGNAWLATAARQLVELGFDLAVDRAPETMPVAARCDAPVLYFGWYAADLDGPFSLPGFRFPPGAIALHIHSYSAATLRSTSAGWTAPLVARGVTATVGNVNEPYLQFTHQPHLLLRALARGETLADAAYYALPALSWQAVVVGDPLYRPFAVSLATQLAERAKGPSRLAGYATLRRMRELEAADRRDEAKAAAFASQREAPALAVAVALAERFVSEGNKSAAAGALGEAEKIRALAPDEWALAADAARLMVDVGAPHRAVELWQKLLRERGLPRELRLAWLRVAQATASSAHATAQAEKWRAEEAELLASEKR